MKTVSVRDLRSRSAWIWRRLTQERDLVVTSKGKPVGILSSATEDNLEETLAALRRARAMLAVLEIQMKSVREGRDKLSPEQINAETAAVRHKRS